MKKRVLVKDILGIESDFDIMKIDLTEIVNAIDQIPSNGVIDINVAEKLATNWLRSADRCGELLALAARWKGIKDTEKKSEFAQAGLRTGQSSAIAQKELAAMDDEYIKKSNDYTDAEGFYILIQQKYQTLLAAHYLAKEIMKKHYQNEVAGGGWNSKGGEESFNNEYFVGPLNDFNDPNADV